MWPIITRQSEPNDERGSRKMEFPPRGPMVWYVLDFSVGKFWIRVPWRGHVGKEQMEPIDEGWGPPLVKKYPPLEKGLVLNLTFSCWRYFLQKETKILLRKLLNILLNMSYAVLTQCLKQLGNKSQFIGSKEDMERIVKKYMDPWLWFDAYHFMVHGSWPFPIFHIH